MATKYAIAIDQFATYSLTLTYTTAAGAVFPLTGYSAAMQVRPTPDSATILATAQVSINVSLGTITCTIPASVTTALVPGSAVYDLTITSGVGVVSRLLEGSVVIGPGVTR